MEKLQSQLNGLELSTLQKLSFEIRESADGADWKCVCKANGERGKTKPSLPVANKDDDYQAYLADEIGKVVGAMKENRDLYMCFARFYSDNMIFRALGEFKELKAGKQDIKSRQKYFTAIMHRLAHSVGKDWIKPCGAECSLRPKC
ncbi:MAG: hypothetical protein ACNI26_08335 [Terasakiella sp.]|uniref:hypothetical protein n=1 Tax=unclassified Terasakiella TaxID=2614952 RepID=UPI003AFFA1F1